MDEVAEKPWNLSSPRTWALSSRNRVPLRSIDRISSAVANFFDFVRVYTKAADYPIFFFDAVPGLIFGDFGAVLLSIEGFFLWRGAVEGFEQVVE